MRVYSPSPSWHRCQLHHIMTLTQEWRTGRQTQARTLFLRSLDDTAVSVQFTAVTTESPGVIVCKSRTSEASDTRRPQACLYRVLHYLVCSVFEADNATRHYRYLHVYAEAYLSRAQCLGRKQCNTLGNYCCETSRQCRIWSWTNEKRKVSLPEVPTSTLS